MRFVVAGAALLLILACRNAPEPSAVLTRQPTLIGRWAAPATVPGASAGFDLSQRADSVQGNGAYAFDLGRQGALQVRGRYQAPSVTLTFVFDFGPQFQFAGQVEDMRMVGTVTDSAGHAYPCTFFRQ